MDVLKELREVEEMCQRVSVDHYNFVVNGLKADLAEALDALQGSPYRSEKAQAILAKHGRA